MLSARVTLLNGQCEDRDRFIPIAHIWHSFSSDNVTMTNEEFKDEFRLHIPPAYYTDDTQENKIIYALSSMGRANAQEVVTKLEELEPGITSDQLVAITKTVLKNLYEKGLIKGQETDGEMFYDTSKMLTPHDGSVNVGLLDPDKDK